MIFVIAAASTSTKAVAILATILVVAGAIIVWATHGENKNPEENEDNRGNINNSAASGPSCL